MGMLSSISYDSKFVMGYIFSDENLFNRRDLINNKEAADILNVCLNYGGELGTELYDIRNSDMSYMDKIYKFSYNILDTDFKLSNVSDNIALKIKSLQETLGDVNLVKTKPNDNTIVPSMILTELRKWSDYYAAGSYQVVYSCKTITRDFWAINNSSCPADYPLRYSSDGREYLGASNCFIIDSWIDAYINARYKENPYDCDPGDPQQRRTNEVKDTDFSSVGAAIYAYWAIIRKYQEWHSSTLNLIIKDFYS